MTSGRNMTATSAVAYAARLAQVDVVAAYPITPQTRIIESIAKFVADGEMKAQFVQVESEHSALAATIAASSNGVRAFTATSSQGLLYMHEMMHWAASARVPIVMANVNRAVAPPWNIYGDHQDAISQRDTGWLQLFAETNQHALDMTLQAFRIAEDPRVQLPVMVNLDGFTLSHTYEQVVVPEPDVVNRFLAPRPAVDWLDVEHPKTINGVVSPEHYIQFRALQKDAARRALVVIEEVGGAFAEQFGRDSGGLVSLEQVDDAEIVFVALGSAASTIRSMVRAWRAVGRKVGVISVRSYRPFPDAELAEALAGARVAVVWDRAYSFGCGGPLAGEVKGALYGRESRPVVLSAVGGFGGAPVGPTELETALEWADASMQGCTVPLETWFGVKAYRDGRPPDGK
jgi:pyruvate/2-oxoacid:ferredoxin oxidoreductase alpha subunit